MTDINRNYAEALADLMGDVLTNMRKEDGAATQQLVENVEAGRAKLLIVSELLPEFKLRCLYVTDSGSSEVYTLSGITH